MRHAPEMKDDRGLAVQRVTAAVRRKVTACYSLLCEGSRIAADGAGCCGSLAVEPTRLRPCRDVPGIVLAARR